MPWRDYLVVVVASRSISRTAIINQREPQLLQGMGRQLGSSPAFQRLPRCSIYFIPSDQYKSYDLPVKVGNKRRLLRSLFTIGARKKPSCVREKSPSDKDPPLERPKNYRNQWSSSTLVEDDAGNDFSKSRDIKSPCTYRKCPNPSDVLPLTQWKIGGQEISYKHIAHDIRDHPSMGQKKSATNILTLEILVDGVLTLVDFFEIDSRDLQEHNTLWMFVFSGDDDRWVYMRVFDQCREEEVWSDFTSNYPGLFAEHRMMRGLARNPLSTEVYYLGCKRNKHDLIGYLIVRPDQISLDLLLFALCQAYAAVSALNRNNLQLRVPTLLTSFQVWRTKGDYEIKLGKMSQKNACICGSTCSGTFEWSSPDSTSSTPRESPQAKAINSGLFDEFFDSILKISYQVRNLCNDHTENFDFPETVSSLELYATSRDLPYNKVKVNNDLDQLRKFMYTWIPIPPIRLCKHGN